MPYTEALHQLAARRHGVFTIAEARSMGFTSKQVASGVAAGRWVRRYRGVYCMAGAPASALQAILAAVLACGPGAVASHRAAAWLWDLVDRTRLEVTAPRRRAPSPGITVHRTAGVRAVTRRGVPCTDPLRTMLDLAALGDAGAVAGAFDRGIASGLFTVHAVAGELGRRAARGVAGVTLLRRCLEARSDAGGGRTTVLESAMDRLVRHFRLPQPERQYEVGCYRLDYAWPWARLAVEVDGYGPHSSLHAFQHDRERQNALVLAGWTVLRFTWDDVCRRPDAVAEAISRALAASRPA